jgi:hypothetical protein
MIEKSGESHLVARLSAVPTGQFRVDMWHTVIIKTRRRQDKHNLRTVPGLACNNPDQRQKSKFGSGANAQTVQGPEPVLQRHVQRLVRPSTGQR